MSAHQKEKLIILAAVNGAQMSPEVLPYVPITPEEIAEAALRCSQVGAAVVHIHPRDTKTKQVSPDIRLLNETVKRIREKSEILIQITGAMGGWRDNVTNRWVRPSDEQRMALLSVDPKPDMMPTPVGTMDMVHPDGYATVSNSPDFLKKIIPGIIKKELGLEMEIWDTSYLYNALRLAEEGVFDKNMAFSLHYCMGEGNGVQPATFRQLLYVSEEGKRLFPQAKWYATARSKNYFQIITLAISLGCNIVRVGLEDNFLLPNGEIAKDNVQLVESAVRIAKDLGREIATTDEAREILSLPK
jgi:3-keto-5-aminohexanoate cleavage enzyme